MQQCFLSFPHHVQEFLLEDNLEKIGNHIDTKYINLHYGDDKWTVLMMICRYLKRSENVNKNILSTIKNFFKKIDYNVIHIPYGIEKIEWLLERGADPNKQNDIGYTALMLAARFSSSERGCSSEKTVEILLNKGADPNKQKKDGWTALMLAARNSSPERGESSEKTVEILLEKGADPKIITNRGETAKDLADESVKQIIDKYILAKKWKIPLLINNGKANGCVCHICDDNNKDVVLKCGHTFCIECIEKIIESQKCPDCREAFTENDIQQFIL